MKLIAYALFRFIIFLVSLFPFWLLYVYSNILSFLLFNVVGYRRKVIERNIELCFPNKSPNEKKLIIKEAYRNFIDIILEGLKGLSMNPNKIIPRYRLKSVDKINEYFDSGRGIFVYCQHFNNWEWGPLCLGLQSKYQLVGIIKTLSNPYINNFVFNGREGNMSTIVPSNETSRYLSSEMLSNKAFIFMSDQLPHVPEKYMKIDFLGLNTKFHTGAAHLACKLNIPVFNSVMTRIKRGHYEVSLHLITDNPAKMSPENLVTKYKTHLENIIRNYPPGWLWSHRRFKDVTSY